MCNTLRKVTFQLARVGHAPEQTPKERLEMEELARERNGLFHCWAQEVDTSKDIPYVKTMALVEDLEDGSVKIVEFDNLRFIYDSSTPE